MADGNLVIWPGDFWVDNTSVFNNQNQYWKTKEMAFHIIMYSNEEIACGLSRVTSIVLRIKVKQIWNGH